ncbi:hypothetical protein GCM10010435_43280 [Winogradskya consettensis]|uniref:Uncharacterized protein n=1 Tax=Winogradskya consettensis TaxID=113560 RepID=A0A919T175_9ACTN|nr:hypothetical protein [Actinoplanes consettensis]GIM83451.1 hypothetical protein Aco04nite_86580 [Actinoplanes consettensis]
MQANTRLASIGTDRADAQTGGTWEHVGGLWVARIQISARTKKKIEQRHGITGDEVRDAVVCIAGLTYKRSYSEERGWRWLIKTQIRERDALIVLYDADDPLGDIYRLGSAYFIDS